MAIVYVLERHFPYEAGEVMGVFSSPKKAMALYPLKKWEPYEETNSYIAEGDLFYLIVSKWEINAKPDSR